MGNTDLASVQVLVYGRVQGVFFRSFVSRRATELGLSGYVRNLPDGKSVEVHAEGERDRLEHLLGYLGVGPPGASVNKVVTSWSEFAGSYSSFTIRY
ncbi:acylphosphatase [Chloroflexota bacterium]